MWDHIEKNGPKYGYHQQPSKTWLIVKPQHTDKAMKLFAGTGVQVTNDGRRHHGAVIGSSEFRDEFMNDKIITWTEELTMLSKIAEHAPHEAYTCFISGYKHKLSYCM
jgi:hypothetical protein